MARSATVESERKWLDRRRSQFDPKRTVDAETMNIGAAELNGTNRDEV